MPEHRVCAWCHPSATGAARCCRSRACAFFFFPTAGPSRPGPRPHLVGNHGEQVRRDSRRHWRRGALGGARARLFAPPPTCRLPPPSFTVIILPEAALPRLRVLHLHLHLFVALAKPSHTCTPHQGFPRINGRTNAGRMPTTEEPHLTSAPGQCRASRERSKSQPLTQHASSAALKALGSSYQNKKETPSARAAQQAVAPPPRLHRSLGASPALLRAARRSLPGAAAGRVRR